MSLYVIVCVCFFLCLTFVRETKKREAHSPFHSTNVDNQFFFLTTGRRFSVDVAVVVVVVVVSHHGFVVLIMMCYSLILFSNLLRGFVSHVSS